VRRFAVDRGVIRAGILRDRHGQAVRGEVRICADGEVLERRARERRRVTAREVEPRADRDDVGGPEQLLHGSLQIGTVLERGIDAGTAEAAETADQPMMNHVVDRE
jgi:hypothetical protein